MPNPVIPLSPDTLKLMAASVTERDETPEDHLTLSPDVLYLNALSEAAKAANMMRSGAPSQRVRRQLAFAALRFLQAGEAYHFQRVNGDPDIREVQISDQADTIPL